MAQGVAAVGHGVLLVAVDLGERAGAAEHVRQEQRVVAEALASPPLVPDAALDRALRHDLRTVLVHEHERACEAGGALGVRHVAQRREQLGVVRGVIARLAGIAGRVHAGRAVERINHQAGVVGQCREPAGRLVRRACLDARVALERVGVLRRVGLYAQFTQRAELPIREVQRRGDLRYLVGVVRGQHHRLHSSSPSLPRTVANRGASSSFIAAWAPRPSPRRRQTRSTCATVSMGSRNTRLPKPRNSSRSSPVVKNS